MIPEFECFILPTLNILSSGKLLSLDEIRDAISEYFKFSHEELNETTRSGNNTKVYDRTAWALTYLRQSGLVESPKRAFAQITYSGLELLENPPAKITREFLYENYESFRDFQNRSGTKKGTPQANIKVPSKVNVKNPVRTRNTSPEMQDLIAARTAVKSFRKLGIEPTQEQLDKLHQLESKILQNIIAEGISNIINDSLSNIADVFVVNIKYCKQRTFIHVDTSDNAIETFPEEKALEINCKSTDNTEDQDKKKRRPNLNFFQMGLITGDVLSYKDDDSVSVTIVSENKVEYNGQLYSLTRLTQELKGLPRAIQPTGEWTFEGQNLLDMYNETYPNND